ncbi:hypothetical protein [Mesorhizobium hawassense]|nr:hypothetical protein [Mesorhizobium hawassense]
MMFFIDLRVAANGQISDKYQYYGLDILPDDAAPAHPAQENRLLA